MENKTIFIEKAYKEAMLYADNTINKSRKIKDNYIERDVFYKGLSTREIMLWNLFTIGSAVALIFKDGCWKLLEESVLGKINSEIFSGFLSTLYTTLFLILMLIGVWKLSKNIYTNKVNLDLKNLDKIADEIEKEKREIFGIKSIIQNAFYNCQYVKVGKQTKWEHEIATYQARVDAIGNNTRKISKQLTIGISVVSVFIFYIVFSPYMVKAIVGEFTYYGTVVVCVSYLLLMEILFRIQMKIAEYTEKSREFVLALFGFFQVPMILQLIRGNAFSHLMTSAEYEQGSDPTWLANIVYFSIKYLINEGFIVIAVSSFIGVMHLIRTNPKHEKDAIKNGIDIPFDNGTSRHVYAESRWIPILLAIVFVIIASSWMAGVLKKGISFGGVILYLFIGLVWFGISFVFKGEDKEFVYGKRLRWIKNAFFFCYMFLTLAQAPGFSVGSVVLLLIQSILSVIIAGILLFFI